jgi:hypothetical protein
MLRILASQDRSDRNGWCRLRVEGLGLIEPKPVELYFRRGGERNPFLAELGWQQNIYWLAFGDTRLEGDALVISIGPAQTWYLGDVATVEVGLRLPGETGEPRCARIAWPKIVLDVEARPGQPAPPPPPEPPPVENPPEPAPVPPPPLMAGAPVAPPLPQPRRAVWPWFLAGLLVFLAAFGGLAYFEHWPPFGAPQAAPAPAVQTPAPPAAATRVYSEDEVRRYLAGNPAAPAAALEAKAYADAGHPDLALVIYRYAQRLGDPSASKAIGRMYDPTGFNKETSAFDAPDADQAATYYEPAAKAGDVEAEFLLGRLLVKGQTSQPDAVERGVVWLQRAQQGGNSEAGALLKQVGGSGSGN